MHDPGRQRDAENGRDQETGQRLRHGVSGVIPERRGLEEAIDDVGGRRQQPRRNVERLDGKLPSGERASENQERRQDIVPQPAPDAGRGGRGVDSRRDRSLRPA